MTLADLLTAINTRLTATASIVGALTAIGIFYVKLRTSLKRSRLIVPNAFPLPEVPGEQAIFDPQYPDLHTMLVGRNSDIANLTRAVHNGRLNFLYGESGSGKSTLLKLGLARQLHQSGAWLPIYLDSWGQDWTRGPRKSLADSTDYALRATNLAGNPPTPVLESTVFARLADLRTTAGRRPVLLFDQLDDYQNQHRALFRNPATGLFLTPDELCAANSFWHGLRDLLLTPGDPVHVVFATRDDAESGLHCFRFEEPGVYPPLARLDPDDASLLIHRLAPETVVRNPENGFWQLVELLVAELSARGGSVLPMQLRIALAGVGRLTGPLTPSRIEGLGGVPGLGARYLESAIRDTPGAWNVLNAMAQRTPDGRGKAVPLTRSQMEALLPPGVNAASYLQKLVDARVLRRRLADSEDESWQLYHDYLADAVVALDRRKRKYSLLLEEAHQRHRLARSFRKWTLLLTPLAQIRLYWHRLRAPGFRFGEHAGFVRVSLLRLALNLWTLSAVLIAASSIVWYEQTEADDIAQAFLQGGDQQQEFRAMWRLASTRSDYVRRSVFEKLLSTSDARVHLGRNSRAALAALGLRIGSLDAMRGLSFETCGGSCMAFSVAAADAATTADRILERMEMTTAADELSGLGSALAALAKGISGNQAAQGADRILERMKMTTAADELSGLGSALAALAKGISGNQATQLADRILERMKMTTNPNELSGLGSALAALAEGISGNQAAQLADRILERMKMTTAADELSGLGSALAALAKGISGNQAAQLADRILERMKMTTNPSELYGFGSALAALAKGISGNQAAQVS
jgi:energy-coupling factor transporter ATP-binding protein EcfA2